MRSARRVTERAARRAIRLATRLDGAGASDCAAVGHPRTSVRGLVIAPGRRAHQVWYRNAAPFCTPSTFHR
jgi:hypothetical protein